MPTAHRNALALIITLLSAADLGAQEVLWERAGTQPVMLLGQAVCGAGDVNGDGYDDFIVGAPNYSLSDALPKQGEAALYSGFDHGVLYRYEGSRTFALLGYAAAGLGDIDGDGLGDFVIGAPGSGSQLQGRAYVHSGVDGHLLFTLNGSEYSGNFGTSAASLGDLDGDGVGDFAIGAEESLVGKVHVYSGADATPRYVFFPGSVVAAPGDVDQDGYPDVLVGAPYVDNPYDGTENGQAWLYSGRDGSVLFSVDGPFADMNLGATVAGGGDTNADGHPDFVIAAPFADIAGPTSGLAIVYSGANYETIDAMLGQSDDALGAGAAIFDLDQDGFADYLIGQSGVDLGGLANVGRITAFSGQGHLPLYTFEGTRADDQFGDIIALAGDVNHDGHPDLINGSPISQSGMGRAQVLAGNDLFMDLEPRSVQAGDQLTLTIAAGPPGNTVALFRVDVNGVPSFKLELISTFGNDRRFSLSTPIKGGYSGVTLGLKAFAIAASGAVVDSARETLILR